MNIYDALRHEHYIIKAFLEKIDALGARKPATRRRHLLELQDLLLAHAAAEEEIFYGPLRRHEETGALSRQARVEHDLVGSLMEVLVALPATDPDWTAYFTVLREVVENHIRQEEKTIFKKARGVLDTATERRMGEEMLLVGKGAEARGVMDVPEPPGGGSQALH